MFASDRDAWVYMLSLATRDLQYRGMRDERTGCFEQKQYANFLLYRRVAQCDNDFEYESLRQQWDTLNRPAYRAHKWSPEQSDAIDFVKKGVSYDDEEARATSYRWLYIQGPPGSGKSTLLLELAVWACSTMSVLLVCPTGFLVKSRLPDIDGIENIRVDTIQGVLNYKRAGADSKVTWSPPSALRRIELILMDEASQYEDVPWNRFFTSVSEQPHKPFTAVVADFQQLQPVVSGGVCRQFCEKMQSVELKTVYRSCDVAHLIFLNRIRFEQPERPVLSEYFDDRQWRGMSMEACVARRLTWQKLLVNPFHGLPAQMLVRLRYARPL